MMKIIEKETVNDALDIVDRVLDEIREIPFAYASLIQLSPDTFPGFMGFKTNTIMISTNSSGGTTTTTGTGATVTDTPETGPVPNGTNFDKYTIITAPYRNPNTNATLGAGYAVTWSFMTGSSLTGSTTTGSNGTATIIIQPGSIEKGLQYTITTICTVQTIPPVPLIVTQDISFLPSN